MIDFKKILFFSLMMLSHSIFGAAAAAGAGQVATKKNANKGSEKDLLELYFPKDIINKMPERLKNRLTKFAYEEEMLGETPAAIKPQLEADKEVQQFLAKVKTPSNAIPTQAAAAGAGAAAPAGNFEQQKAHSEESAPKVTITNDAEFSIFLKDLFWRKGKFQNDQAYIAGLKEYLALRAEYTPQLKYDYEKKHEEQDYAGFAVHNFLKSRSEARKAVSVKVDKLYPLEARFKPVKGEDTIAFERERIPIIEGYWSVPSDSKRALLNSPIAFPVPVPHEKAWKGKQEFLTKLIRIQAVAMKELFNKATMGSQRIFPRIFIDEGPQSFFFINGSDCRLGCWGSISYGTAPHFIDPASFVEWQGMLFHYIEKHNVIPSREFYRYIMNFPEDLLQKMEKEAQKYELYYSKKLDERYKLARDRGYLITEPIDFMFFVSDYYFHTSREKLGLPDASQTLAKKARLSFCRHMMYYLLNNKKNSNKNILDKSSADTSWSFLFKIFLVAWE